MTRPHLRRRRLMMTLVALAAAGAAAAVAQGLAAGAAGGPVKAVYHIDDAALQGLRGLRSLRNHLDTDPGAQVIVVTHGNGVDLLLEGATDRQGNAYAGLVSALRARGVRFEVCELTLKARQLPAEQFIQEADFTPSGVARIARLQQQGYAYLKP